ncbi:MAG: hypothetical protein AB7H71_02605 [Alphaproteobacteria bacterium]
MKAGLILRQVCTRCRSWPSRIRIWLRTELPLPPADRRIEALIQLLLFIGLVGVGLAIQWEEHRISESNSETFRNELKILESRSHAGISGALLNSIMSCAGEKEARKLMFNILKMTADNVDAPNQMNAILTAAKNCIETTPEATITTGAIATSETIIGRQRESSTEDTFLRAVRLGFQSYRDGYLETAAKDWYDAMTALPQVYLDEGKVRIEKINQARIAFESKDYEKAADKFRDAFSNVSK